LKDGDCERGEEIAVDTEDSEPMKGQNQAEKSERERERHTERDKV
jgi:hypothetical protein